MTGVRCFVAALALGACSGRPANQGDSTAAVNDHSIRDTRGRVAPHWQVLAPRLAVTAHTATRLRDGAVLIVNGLAPDREGLLQPSPKVYRYLPEQDRLLSEPDWTPPPGYNLAEAHYGHGALLLPDGRVLVKGGNRDSYRNSDTTDIFDPARVPGRWQPSIVFDRGSGVSRRISLFLSPDDRIVAEYDCDGRLVGRVTVNLVAMRLGDSEWQLLGRRAETPLSCGASVFQLPSGQILRAGSEGRYWGNRTYLFDPSTGVDRRGPELDRVRGFSASVMLADGTILLVGGRDGYYAPRCTEACTTAVLFDPQQKGVRAVFQLPDPYPQGHTATLVSDDAVVVLGGMQEQDATGTGLLLRSDGSYITLPKMPAARSAHTTTLLEDGTLLIVGGTEKNGFGTKGLGYTMVPQLMRLHLGDLVERADR